MKDIATIERVKLPDLTRPVAQMSLPAWLNTQRDALAMNLQTVGKSFAEVATLPATLMPTKEQRVQISALLNHLRQERRRTGRTNDNDLKETMAIVSKLMIQLKDRRQSDEEVAVNLEAYEIALESIPVFAVRIAAWRWLADEAGNDLYGKPYDCRWMPDHVTLKRLAMQEVAKIDLLWTRLRMILEAHPFRNCEKEMEDGRAAFAGLMSAVVDPDKPKLPTWREAIKKGRNILEKMATASVSA